MKKFSIIMVLAIIFSVFTASMLTVYAADPDDLYSAAKLVYPVTADGIITGEEWDDANSIILTTKNPVMNAFGRYQGGDENFFANTKVTYKIKWDENNLYILEVREDKDAWVYDPDNALHPWEGNGTLFFISYGNNPKWGNAYEIFWTAKSGDGKAKVALRAFLDGRDGPFDSSDDAKWIGNWKYAGAVTGTNSVFEIIIPWTDLQKFNADIGMKSTMSGGEKFQFTPIVPKHKDDGSSGQMNYHDKYDRPDAITDENSNPGELPVNWAPMILSEAIIVPEEIIVDTTAAAVDNGTAAPVVSTAPQTSDCTFVIFAGLIALLGAALIVKKVRG